MLREIGYSLLGLGLLAYALDFAFSHFDDPREPSRVLSKVPLIGHLLGLIQGGPGYYGKTSKKTSAEMYTLAIFNTKLYISNTQRLFPVIQKASKTVSFRPFIQTASKVFGDASDETFELFDDNLIGNLTHATRGALGPGPHLDAQNLRMGRRALAELDSLPPQGDILLLNWVRRVVVQATSCGVWGEAHPFIDPEVEKAYWKWTTYVPLHLFGMDIFRRGYTAREVVYDSFRNYFKSIPADASQLFHERQRVISEASVSEEDMIKQEASSTHGVFPNTVVTLYWIIWELFSRPQVLEEVRSEVFAQAVKGSAIEGFVVDVAALKTKCPLLLSMCQETQRTRHVHANIRKVMDDTLLDGKYLVKKGNFVQMPGQPIHVNTGAWGPSAETFDPYRFVGDSKLRAITPSSFVAWGAPPHLCPARQFASTEILIIVALLATRFDLKPLDGGLWEEDPAVNTGDFVTIFNPRKDVKLQVSARENGMAKWKLNMAESTTRVPLASG